MKEHVRLRKEYVKLIQDGKLVLAEDVLKQIQSKSYLKNQKVEPEVLLVEEQPIQKIVEVKTKRKVSKKKKGMISSLDDLSKIKGIGKKTMKDIKVMFDDISTLKKSLKYEKVGLRDDIVEKLKKEFKIK